MKAAKEQSRISLAIVTLVLVIFLFSSCAEMESSFYSPGSSPVPNTAVPYYVEDDEFDDTRSMGIASIYSFFHDAIGIRFDFPPGTHRNVWKTHRGRIFAIVLYTQADTLKEYVFYLDLTDSHDLSGIVLDMEKTYKLGSWRATEENEWQWYYGVDRSPSAGKYFHIKADGEIMSVSLSDLYKWRLKKVNRNANVVTIGGREFSVLGAKTDKGMAGFAFFRNDSEGRVRSDRPEYVVTTTRGRSATRVQEDVPIGESGYVLSYSLSLGRWEVKGHGETSVVQGPDTSGIRVFQKCRDSVVMILAGNSKGTGFLVASKRVMTNWHVVSDAQEGEVAIVFNDGRRMNGQVIAKDVERDMALVSLAESVQDCTPLYLSVHEPKVGSKVWVIGHPAGEEWSLTGGGIAALRGDDLQLDSSINPGNSGGPVLDVKGRVVGLVKSRGEKTPGGRQILGMGMAVGADAAKKFMEQNR
jgi:putative serine protease PepD